MASGEYWEMLFADWNEMCLNYPNKKTIFSDYFHSASFKKIQGLFAGAVYICSSWLIVSKYAGLQILLVSLPFKMYSSIRQGVKFWQMTVILSPYL